MNLLHTAAPWNLSFGELAFGKTLTIFKRDPQPHERILLAVVITEEEELVPAQEAVAASDAILMCYAPDMYKSLRELTQHCTDQTVITEEIFAAVELLEEIDTYHQHRKRG